MANKLPNASLTYYIVDDVGNGTPYGIDIWVDVVSQTNQLSGESSQSRMTKHFYPRAHMPGNYVIEGTCESQSAYAKLAQFIRKHQLAMMNQPVGQDFSRIASHTGYRRLLTLSIPTESIWIRGFVPRFTIQRHGVFEPAPKFNFDFFVVFDQHSTDLRLSSDIRKYFQGGFDTSDIQDTPETNITPTVTLPPGGFARHKPLP